MYSKEIFGHGDSPCDGYKNNRYSLRREVGQMGWALLATRFSMILACLRYPQSNNIEKSPSLGSDVLLSRLAVRIRYLLLTYWFK